MFSTVYVYYCCFHSLENVASFSKVHAKYKAILLPASGENSITLSFAVLRAVLR
jgi:hypothetical protein